MRRGLSLFPLALLLIAAADAAAQTRERVKVSNVRLGFASSRGGLYKAGQWAPVYVDLECVRDIDPPENLLVIVETMDADETYTEAQVEISGLKLKGDQLKSVELGRIPYLKPGSIYSSVGVRIKGKDSGKNYGEASDKSFSAIKTPTFVLLGVGTNLNGLKFPANNFGDDSNRGGWVQSAQILEVGQLPDQWIGYGAADLVILGTGGDRDFWIKLSEQGNEKRRIALAEWVRRGGRLVISLGSNPDLLDALKEIKEMLPATVGAKKPVRSLPFSWQGASSSLIGAINFVGNAAEFPTVALQPRADRATKVILAKGDDVTASQPIAIQGPYGLGRVTVFGFDLDRPPFTDWAGRAGFWENIVDLCGYKLPTTGKLDDNTGSTRYDEFSSGLQGSLDFFEGVPVVSFGWVALFILIYIILIGPIDYLFLKKVVRRLEWTWVTFPIIVITVSAGAYFAAYALKGKDLKTNKVDIVDIDLAGKRIDGNTWFTLFSPRIHNYTISVEPAGPIDGDASVPAWTPAAPGDAAHETVISWQASVERNKYGTGSGGLFTRRYKYETGTDPTDPNRELYAAGVEGVPIQVWTTKAFHAQWSAPLDPAKPPIVADLSVSPFEGNVLLGKITNNLPVGEFTDMAIFWRGKAFSLQDFPMGVTKEFSLSAEPGGSEEDIKSWVMNTKRLPPGATPWIPQTTQSYSFSGNEPGTTTHPIFVLWPVMFADFATETARQYAQNASLRRLDQSWRVDKDRPEQAILVLRMATKEGPAEDMSRSALSPSRLWIGKLPTEGGKRPVLQGTLKQETYIRVLIPVKMPKNPKR